MENDEIINFLKNLTSEKNINIDWTLEDVFTKNFKELGVDSLDLFDIISNIEDHYQILFEDEVLKSMKNLNELIFNIQKLVQQK